MIRITLPDGSQREYDQPLTVFEVAASIGTGLAKAAVAGRVDGMLVDCGTLIEQDAAVSIITPRDTEGLEILRHSCAHLLAMAVKQLYPSAQVTIGPVIEDGFFYDFAYERAFTPKDLELIEAQMQALAATNHSVRRRELPRDEAIACFEERGEHYKAELIRAIAEGEVCPGPRGEDGDAVAETDQEVDMYHQPGEPGHEPAPVRAKWPLDFGHCGEPSDGRHVALVEIMKSLPLPPGQIRRNHLPHMPAHLHCGLRHAGDWCPILLKMRQIAANEDLRQAGRVQLRVHRHRPAFVHRRAQHFAQRRGLHAGRPQRHGRVNPLIAHFHVARADRRYVPPGLHLYADRFELRLGFNGEIRGKRPKHAR